MKGDNSVVVVGRRWEAWKTLAIVWVRVENSDRIGTREYEYVLGHQCAWAITMSERDRYCVAGKTSHRLCEWESAESAWDSEWKSKSKYSERIEREEENRWEKRKRSFVLISKKCVLWRSFPVLWRVNQVFQWSIVNEIGNRNGQVQRRNIKCRYKSLKWTCIRLSLTPVVN